MTDYQNDKKAEKRAYKYRWLVWCFWPAVLAFLWIFRNEFVFIYYTRFF